MTNNEIIKNTILGTGKICDQTIFLQKSSFTFEIFICIWVLNKILFLLLKYLFHEHEYEYGLMMTTNTAYLLAAYINHVPSK